VLRPIQWVGRIDLLWAHTVRRTAAAAAGTTPNLRACLGKRSPSGRRL